MSRGRRSSSKLIVVPVDTDLRWQSTDSRPPAGLLPKSTLKAAKNALNSAIANNENFVPMTSPDRDANRAEIAGVLSRVLMSKNSARQRSWNPLSYLIGTAGEREMASELYDAAMDLSRGVVHGAEKCKTVVVIYRNSGDEYTSGRIGDRPEHVDGHDEAREDRAGNGQEASGSTVAVDNRAHPTEKLVTVLSAEPLSEDADYAPSAEGVWSMVDARAFVSPFMVEPTARDRALVANRDKALPGLPVAMPIAFEIDPRPSGSVRHRYTMASTNFSIPSSAPPEYQSARGTLMAIDDVDEMHVRIVSESRTPLERAKTAPNMRCDPAWL